MSVEIEIRCDDCGDHKDTGGEIWCRSCVDNLKEERDMLEKENISLNAQVAELTIKIAELENQLK